MLKPTGKSNRPAGLQWGNGASDPFPALSERQQSQESGCPCLSLALSNHPAWKWHPQGQEKRPARENLLGFASL